MEPKQPGNKKMPDFNQLTDRMIADSPSEPMLVIKTNLDPKGAAGNNPYYRNGEVKNAKAFKNYFEKD